MTLREYANSCKNDEIVSGIFRAVTNMDNFEVRSDTIENNKCCIKVKEIKGKSEAMIVIPLGK